MAQQVKTITSESLEAAYRALTPSQDGFTEDLMASNTIIPVLSLNASSLQTTTPQYLQTALAFGSQTAFETENATTTLANTAGFWRLTFTFALKDNSAAREAYIGMTDGLSTKQIVGYDNNGFFTTNRFELEYNDLTFFLRSGDSLVAYSNSTGIQLKGSYRQVADVNGNLVYPSGFTPQ